MFVNCLGPVKCLVLYLLVFGRLKYLMREEKDSYRFLMQSYLTSEVWSKHCLKMDPIFNRFFLTGFLKLTELILNAVVQKAHADTVNGAKCVRNRDVYSKFLYDMSKIMTQLRVGPSFL